MIKYDNMQTIRYLLNETKQKQDYTYLLKKFKIIQTRNYFGEPVTNSSTYLKLLLIVDWLGNKSDRDFVVLFLTKRFSKHSL